MRATIFVVAAFVITPGLGAQAPACDSSALRTPIGTQTDTLRVFLRRADLSGALPSAWALNALDGLRRAFVLPANVAFSAYTGGSAPGTAVATARATLLFDARRNGTADIRGMLSRSGSDALDASLAAAIRGASAERAFAPFPPELGRDVRLVAELFFGTGDSLRAGMDVAELQLPVFRDYSAASSYRDSSAGAKSSQLLAQAIARINAAGGVEPESVDFVTIQDMRSAAHLLARLRTITQPPARIAGCAVPALTLFMLVPPN